MSAETALALPEAVEKETWGNPTFRVRDRIFALVSTAMAGSRSGCKAPEGSQMVLVGADPDRFFVPRYVGHKGWVGTSSHFGFLGCGGVGWLGWGRLRRCSAGRARWRPSEGQGFQELGPGGEHNVGAQGL